ncbi:acyloxyacyl hydrolase [Pontibaca methylaminivorans]|uniref:acyloxyacyl hydrolase n=1 Tax=Pontibaca methylaminivorans TaxID=515897 RepID=UPI002FDA8153
MKPIRDLPLVAALLAALLVPFAAPSAARAQELVLGLGYTSYSDEHTRDAPLLTLDYNFRPFHSKGRFEIGWGAALEINTRGDAFGGAGLVLTQGLGDQWFVNASVMPGLYRHAGSYNDLGSTFEIRSLVGIGYRLYDGSSIALALSHKSNASTASRNPGVNALTLRWHRPF